MEDEVKLHNYQDDRTNKYDKFYKTYTLNTFNIWIVVLQHNGGWILQRLHHKTDLVLISFPFSKKTNIIQIITKTLDLYFLRLLP